MRTVGIIAEYNPFHNGHFHQMLEAKRLARADYLVVIMSPDFVQRGEPALLDKWARAQMALDAGADLVLELPVRYAAGSAEYFAGGAVSTLAALGVVDALSFGCEMPQDDTNDNLTARPADDLTDILYHYAEFLSQEEPEEYSAILKEHLRKGVSFAEARCLAYLSFTGQEDPDGLLRSPNNILAIEYIKAILKTGADMSIIPVRRIGAGYHDVNVRDHAENSYSSTGNNDSSSMGSHIAAVTSYDHPAKEHSSHGNSYECPSEGLCTTYASATGIRSALSRGDSVQNLMPPKAWRLLNHEMSLHRFLVPSDLDLPLHLALCEKRTSLTDYVDVSEDLANRIENLLPQYLGFDQFTDLLKTRQIAYTRVRRALLHILLGLQKSASHTFFPASYARVLGFRKSALPLLHEIKERGSIPLITKLPPEFYNLDSLEEDLRAAQLWEIIASHKTGAPARNERQRHILIGEDEPD